MIAVVEYQGLVDIYLAPKLFQEFSLAVWLVNPTVFAPPISDLGLTDLLPRTFRGNIPLASIDMGLDNWNRVGYFPLPRGVCGTLVGPNGR